MLHDLSATLFFKGLSKNRFPSSRDGSEEIGAQRVHVCYPLGNADK